MKQIQGNQVIFPKRLDWDETNAFEPKCLIPLSNGVGGILIKIYGRGDHMMVTVNAVGKNDGMDVRTTENRKTLGQRKNAKKVARQMAEKAFKLLTMR